LKKMLANHKQRMLDRHNITLSRAIAPISLALDAKVTIKTEDEDGNVVKKEVADIDTRLKGSDRALKLLGVTETDEGKGNTYNFVQLLSQDHDGFTA